MWSRVTFWCVFAAFILNILQPGYMQFYDVRKPLVAFIEGLKEVAARESQQNPASSQVIAKPTIQPTAQTITFKCQSPRNDYERVLFAQGIGGCDARRN